MTRAVSSDKMPIQVIGELIHEKIAQNVIEPMMIG
jgi:hypothetical protein